MTPLDSRLDSGVLPLAVKQTWRVVRYQDTRAAWCPYQDTTIPKWYPGVVNPPQGPGCQAGLSTRVSLHPLVKPCQAREWENRYLTGGVLSTIVFSSMSESHQHTSGWGTQPGSGRNPEYNRGRFLIQSTNKWNHSMSIRPFGRKEAETSDLPETAHLPVETVAQMHQLVSDPRTPYRSIQDLVRDAIHHRLHDLAEMMEDGTYEEFFNAELWKQGLMLLIREDQAFAEQQEFFDGLIQSYAAERNADGMADAIRMWRDRRPPLRHIKRWMEAAAGWERLIRELR